MKLSILTAKHAVNAARLFTAATIHIYMAYSSRLLYIAYYYIALKLFGVA